jgi:hypothetical protein
MPQAISIVTVWIMHIIDTDILFSLEHFYEVITKTRYVYNEKHIYSYSSRTQIRLYDRQQYNSAMKDKAINKAI